MAVRKMTPGDLPDAARLEKECFSDPWTLEMLAESLADPLYRFYVNETNGTVTGYAGMYQVLDEGNIANIAVSPSFRRQGTGEALLREMIGRARENGVSVMFLEVRENNIPAISLYRKLGFVETGFRKNYYHDPEEGARIFSLTF